MSCRGLVSLRLIEQCSLRININGFKTVVNGESRAFSSFCDSSAVPGIALRCLCFTLARRGRMLININAAGQFLNCALSAMEGSATRKKVIILHTKAQVSRKKWWKTAFGRTAPLSRKLTPDLTRSNCMVRPVSRGTT